MNNKTHNNAINSDVQKWRFALLLHAGYGKRYAGLSGDGAGQRIAEAGNYGASEVRQSAMISYWGKGSAESFAPDCS